MSIASEITRLQGVKSDILTAISDKGVTVPAGSALDDCPGLIADIPTMANGSVKIGEHWYRTAKIGNKVWLAENLDYKFSGCDIGPAGEPTNPAAWYYTNNEITYGWYGYKCGLLYNYYAVLYLDEHKATLCPGWHVATIDDFDNLVSIAGGISTGGTKLKSSGTIPRATSFRGTDDFGFSGCPSGSYVSGNYYAIDENLYMWASTDNKYYMLSPNADVLIASYGSTKALSIRLVKDS